MVACGVLAVLLVFLGLQRGFLRGGDRAAEVRAEWRDENRDSLMHLSAIREMSRAEQARLETAGDDLERMRRAMVRVHEDRLANAHLDLQDAEARQAEMRELGRYKVYADRPQGRDLVELASEEERTATAQIASYGIALSRIRAWSPMSYETYAAAKMGHGEGVAAQTLSRVAAAPPKPTAAVGLERLPQQAGQKRVVLLPDVHETGKTAQSASLTVYAGDKPSVRAGRAAEAGGSEREEQEVQQTLRRWSGAMVLNDPKAEAAEYAPHMDRYFLRKDVDKAFVEADKAAYLRRGNETAAFTLRDVTIESETDRTADVRLVKDVTWRRGPGGETHKLIRSRLQLTHLGDGWKISSEQDFR